jgi:hypothetical protein
LLLATRELPSQHIREGFQLGKDSKHALRIGLQLVLTTPKLRLRSVQPSEQQKSRNPKEASSRFQVHTRFDEAVSDSPSQEDAQTAS